MEPYLLGPSVVTTTARGEIAEPLATAVAYMLSLKFDVLLRGKLTYGQGSVLQQEEAARQQQEERVLH